MYNQYALGSRPELTASFIDHATGDPVDPEAVFLSVRSPDQTLTTFEYGDEDAAIVRDDVGEYHAAVDADQAGYFYYRWWSVGDGQAAEENRFKVLPAQAVAPPEE